MSGVTTRRKQQRDATAMRLFETAMRLFAEQGFERTTIAQITRAAGVAKGTFFVHYPSKEAVLEQLGQLQMERLRDVFLADPELGSAPFSEQFRRLLLLLGERLEAHADLVLVLAVESLRQRGAAMDAQNINALDALLADLISAAQQRGELRSDMSASQIAGFLRNLYFMSVFEWLRQQDEPFPTVADRYVTYALQGVAL